MNEQKAGVVGLIVIAAIAYIVISWIIARSIRPTTKVPDGYGGWAKGCSVYKNDPYEIRLRNDRKKGGFLIIMLLFPISYIIYELMND